MSESESELEASFGPQHPALHGVLRLRLRFDGERIVACEPVIGHLHRGIEKLFEQGTYADDLALTDRLDYVAAATANLAYAGAVERLLGVEVPPRARRLRTALAELQRVASHLLALAGQAADLGATRAYLACVRLRERALDLLEEYCGARLTLSCVRIGGLPRDPPPDWCERCAAFATASPVAVDEIEERLAGDRVFKRRAIGLGVLAPETAIDYGVTGPMLRASGIDWDLRKAMPYEAYSEMEFEVPLGHNGDAWDRALVRIGEMRQSLRMLGQCLADLPDGPFVAPPAAVAERTPALGAETYHAVEGPRGEVGFYLIAGGGAMPHRCHLRSPSLRNLQALPEMVRGHKLEELVMLLGSLDLVLSEADR